MDRPFGHYTRNEEEKRFDAETIKTVADNGTKSELALCLQNQLILSMLRHMEDELNIGRTR